MVKKVAVKIWIDGAKDSMITCDKLFINKRYHHSLFFLQLSLEKILKAVFISKKNESPPYIHNLSLIAEKLGLNFSDEEVHILDEISEFNIAGRYEDYKYKMYKKATSDYTQNLINKGKNLFDKFLKLV